MYLKQQVNGQIIYGQYIEYNPTVHYPGRTDHELYLKDDEGNYYRSGLNGRETIISYSPRVELSDVPSRGGVKYEINKSPPSCFAEEIHSIMQLLPPLD